MANECGCMAKAHVVDSEEYDDELVVIPLCHDLLIDVLLDQLAHILTPLALEKFQELQAVNLIVYHGEVLELLHCNAAGILLRYGLFLSLLHS